MKTPEGLIDDVADARGFADSFSSNHYEAAKRAASAVPADAPGREDLRNIPLVTMDGADARDFDDAIACRVENAALRLWVAIADVAAFVPHGEALDKEAARRGNSVYLPGRVYPMLPPALSDDACSLNPDEDRLCLACEMTIEDGEIKDYRFIRGVMRSGRRYVYEEAAADMKAGLLPDLTRVGHELRQARLRRGAFMMERPEVAVFIENGEPEIRTIRRNAAHLLVEECMIAANRCAADFVIRRRIPALHRVHKPPSVAGVRSLTAVLEPLGISFPARPEAQDFGKAMDRIAAMDSALADCLLPAVLGALSRAEYAPDSKTGHFGLACDRYLHFTSPIRRYPDLVAHRAIIAGMENAKPPAADMSDLGAHCSETEVSADKAGWECRQKLLCWRARRMKGMDFDVVVSGTLRFGVFVSVPELGIDGMARIASFPGYWEHDAASNSFTSSRTGRVIRIGDRMRMRLISISPEQGKADFKPVAM